MFMFCYSAFRIIAIYNVICTKRKQKCQCSSLASYKQSLQVDTSCGRAEARSSVAFLWNKTAAACTLCLHCERLRWSH